MSERLDGWFVGVGRANPLDAAAMQHLPAKNRLSPADRWKLFWFGMVPLAIFWGVFITIVRDVDRGAWHPIAAGVGITVTLAGLLGVMLWAAGYPLRWLAFLVVLMAYWWYRHSWGFLHYAGLIAALIELRSMRVSSHA